MKQRYLIILELAFLCLPVLAAENYFRPGTVWTVETSYDFMHFSVHDEFIGDEIEVEGEKVLPFYRSGHGDRENARLTMYMRSEGDKVFWRSIDEEYPEWHLMYDFGLTAGEETVITWAHTTPGVVLEFSFKCVKTDVHDPDKEGLWMNLEQYRGSETDPIVSTGQWIIGIGSPNNPTENIFDLDGDYSNVVEVVSDGVVVYSSPLASVGNIDVSNELNISTYDLQGRKIDSSAKGLIIERQGSKTVKTLRR